MKIMTTTILAAALLLGAAGPAAAQPAHPADGIGVFADVEARFNSVTAGAYSMITAYLVLVNPSEPTGLRGWECAIDPDPNLTLLDWTPAGDPLDVGPLGGVGHICGFAGAVPAAPAVVLGTLQMMYMGDGPAYVRLEPASPSSLNPAAPLYAPGHNDHQRGLVPLTVLEAGPGGAVFGVNGEMTGVTPPAAPARLVLHQNEPNPFNPATTLRFETPADGPVDLVVHDLAGRAVRTLLRDDFRRADRHAVVWNGRDDAGREVAAGVYVARLVTAAGARSLRMTMVR